MSTPTKSGIRKLSNGESVIPSSTRPDGSVRKAIRVKPGYKPPEDVEVYKNRTAQAWKDRGKGGVPGAVPSEEGEKLAPHRAVPASAAKNAKRREARKKAAAVGKDENVQDEGPSPVDKQTDEENDPEEQRAKEARKLAKKLRQARELKDKKDKGDCLLPEQFEKVIKINELMRQLDKLGFDADGDHKEDDVRLENGNEASDALVG